MVEKYSIHGVIATNTSINKKIVERKRESSSGGISGKPLFEKSNKIIYKIREQLP